MGILPGALARVLSRAEPYGLLILIGPLFVLPMLGVDTLSRLIMTSTNEVAGTLLRLTGNILRAARIVVRMTGDNKFQ